MRPCIFWDVEITTPDKGMVKTEDGTFWPYQLVQGSIWDDYPFHISCASVRYSTGKNIVLVGGTHERPHVRGLGRAEVVDLLDLLIEEQAKNDAMIFTHNGSSFDYRLLAQETGRYGDAARLMLDSYDLCFQLLCTLGYPVGLGSLCLGMGLPGKLEKGEDAPLLWEQQYFERVLDYVSGDTLALKRVLRWIQSHKYAAWTSQNGNASGVVVGKFLTVRECLRLPKPDTSWMEHALVPTEQIQWIVPHVRSENAGTNN